MKKEYSAPYLIVESFQLDTAIANCSSDGGAAIGKSLDSCMMDDGSFYFASYCSDNEGVDVTDPNDSNDKICYQGPLGDTVFLAS